MRYSNLLGKTKKEAPKSEESRNAQLLIRAGFIQKEMAGAYVFLPLGLRVLNKIINIIREEMVAIGGQEVMLSSLQDPTNWKKSERWDDTVVDVWFKTKLKNDSEIGLAFTHEEPLTDILKNYVNSYKDLPLYIFQFQTKFRNELRARSGLLRTREFIMKDLYSFSRSEEELNNFYELAKQAYINIFDKLGIGDHTFLTFASGGSFSKYSHEFQTVCEAGEDIIYLDRSKKLAVNKEVYNDEVLNDLGLDKTKLEEVKSIEVGNIFAQKTRFTEPLELNFTHSDGTVKPVMMGAYGIGPARTMATIVELLSDSKGLVWPENISPYKVHLIGLNLDDAGIKTKIENVYTELTSKGIEVLFDDREGVSAGEKFADADLIGIGIRAVVSKKSGDMIEVKKRTEDSSNLVSLTEFFKAL